MPSKPSGVRPAPASVGALLTAALLAVGGAPASVRAQDPDFTVLSVYVEDAAGGATLQPNRTINVVLIANNKGDGTARNARLRVELRSPTVAFVDQAGARTRDVVLGDFGGRVSEQVLVPVVATERTASIDLVVTPLFDGQRGAPSAQTHRLPTGFSATAISSQPQPTPNPRAPSVGTTPMPGAGWPAPGSRLTRAQILALTPDPSRMLGPNQSVNGRLGSGSFRLDDGTPVDIWFYEGTQGERITITESSSNFDSFLLFGRRGGSRVLATDDDGGGSLNSRITQTLPATDVYVVIANVLGSGSSGSYSLRLETNRRITAQDAASNDRRNTISNVVGAATAAAGSAGAGGGGGGGGGNERIAMRQQPSGPISSTEVFALPVDESRIVRMGATVQGTLAAGDLLLSDNTFLDVYYFNGFEGDRVSVTLRSRAFDAYLHFGELGGSSAIATDDDSGSGTDARVTVTLPRTGTFVIIANALSAGGRGAYTLEVRSP